MAVIKVNNLPLIGQPTDGVCWYACAQMLYSFSQANGGTMKDPATNEITKATFDRNSTWDASNAALLAATLGMGKKSDSDIPMDYELLWYILSVNGPLWTSVWKNWGGHAHGHVVVIAGARDGDHGGVFIHDPEPMKGGSSYWLTWAQINSALKGMTDIDYRFLVAQ